MCVCDYQLCVAVPDAGGDAVVYNGTDWSTPARIDPNGGGLSVSCPAAGACAVVDDRGQVIALGKALSSTGSYDYAPIAGYQETMLLKAKQCQARLGGLPSTARAPFRGPLRDEVVYGHKLPYPAALGFTCVHGNFSAVSLFVPTGRANDVWVCAAKQSSAYPQGAGIDVPADRINASTRDECELHHRGFLRCHEWQRLGVRIRRYLRPQASWCVDPARQLPPGHGVGRPVDRHHVATLHLSCRTRRRRESNHPLGVTPPNTRSLLTRVGETRTTPFAKSTLILTSPTIGRSCLALERRGHVGNLVGTPFVDQFVPSCNSGVAGVSETVRSTNTLAGGAAAFVADARHALRRRRIVSAAVWRP